MDRDGGSLSKVTVLTFDPKDRDHDAWRRAETFLTRRKARGSRQADISLGRLIFNSEVARQDAYRASAGVLLYDGWGGKRTIGAGIVERPPDDDLAHMPTEIDVISRYPWLDRGLKRLLIGQQIRELRRDSDIESFNMPYRLDERRRFITGIRSAVDIANDARAMNGVIPAMEPLYVEYAAHLMRTRDFGILSILGQDLDDLEREYLNWLEVA